jgi:hypothetical protein
MKKLFYFFICIIFLGCTGSPSNPVTPPKSSDKTITVFNLKAADNVGVLTYDVSGIISTDSIYVLVPYGTAVNNLKPSITIKGKSVSPASLAAQNFTNPVEYTVTAEDGSTKKYVVVVVTEAGPDITVDNKWQCEIDGVLYTGTIDTSFIDIINSVGTPFYDSLIYCTGTSSDKKANISFWIDMKRNLYPDGVFSSSHGMSSLGIDMNIDNSWTSVLYGTDDVDFVIDSFVTKKVKGTFSGRFPNSQHTAWLNVTNGRFSCEFGKGDNEPKQISFNAGSSVYGYTRYARLEANTLIIDATVYNAFAGSNYKLTVHTGGTIKPGTYESKDGNAGFRYFFPSTFPYAIGDSLGNMSVTITAVNGDVVEGTFHGHSEFVLEQEINDGRFKCRIQNYHPQQDSVNKWKFLVDNIYMADYSVYGGNIIKAEKTFSSNYYRLSVDGTSDNDNSQFKLAIFSTNPIDTGYYAAIPGNKIVEAIYFKTGSTYPFYYGSGSTGVYCHIDHIDDQSVSGTMGYNPSIGQFDNFVIRKGSFTASFH